MKTDRIQKPFYGLRLRFALLIILWGGICIALFCATYFPLRNRIIEYCSSEEFIKQKSDKCIRKMQEFAYQNLLRLLDIQELVDWSKRERIVYIELYLDKQCIYSTSYDKVYWRVIYDTYQGGSAVYARSGSAEDAIEESEDEYYPEIHLGDWEQTYRIRLRDAELETAIYLDDTSYYITIMTVAEVVVCAAMFIILFLWSNKKLISYVCRLESEIHILEGGNLDYPITVQGKDELAQLAQSVDSMRCAFKEQIEREATMHEANKMLITEMSHDLRTPLTSLLLYTEILRYHKYQSEEQLQEYLEKIETKAHQIKQLSANIFNYSKSNEERGEKLIPPKSLEKCFAALLEEAAGSLKEEGFQVEKSLVWEPCYVVVRPDYAERIRDNIVSNLSKYADKDAPICFQTVYTDTQGGIFVLNTIREQKDAAPESNGIGLKSVRTMVEEMQGSCQIEQSDIGFSITVLFPKQ